jgi:hypothetical protein
MMLRSRHKIDILEKWEEDEVPKVMGLLDDTLSMFGALGDLLQVQIDQRGLDEDEFVKRFGGKALKDATRCFFRAITDFFLAAGQPLKAAAITKGLESTVLAMDYGSKKIEGMDLTEKVKAKVDALVRIAESHGTGSQSGTSQAPPE